MTASCEVGVVTIYGGVFKFKAFQLSCFVMVILWADYVKGHPHLGEEPVDIEDLVKIGKAEGP